MAQIHTYTHTETKQKNKFAHTQITKKIFELFCLSSMLDVGQLLKTQTLRIITNLL